MPLRSADNATNGRLSAASASHARLRAANYRYAGFWYTRPRHADGAFDRSHG